MSGYLDECRAALELMAERYIKPGTDEVWPQTLALIEHAPQHFGPYLQRVLGCGNYMHNRAQCGTCNEIIESKNRHDFATCRCEGLSVDGGTWYLKRSVGAGPYTDMSLPWPWCRIDD